MIDFTSHLSSLRKEGIIGDIDFELCRFLKEQLNEQNDEVLLAACLISSRYRQGDVCISLEEYADGSIFEGSTLKAPALEKWIGQLEESSVVGKPGEFKPLILDSSNRLYLQKLWNHEQALANNILTRAGEHTVDIDSDLLKDGLDRLFEDSGSGDNWQKVAAAAALLNRFTVISGGPGTGKTTTVVRVLALMIEQSRKHNTSPTIALAAPTGKAAARLKESISRSKKDLAMDEEIRQSIPSDAVTIHQLLGARRHTAQFRYNADNPLPFDFVIVDEASMVDQALMRKLMEALLHNTKLILIGDKDQLASVEAGSVLGSICSVDHNELSGNFADQLKELSIDVPREAVLAKSKVLTDHIVLLKKSYRFNEKSGIPKLSAFINKGDADNALKLITSNKYEGIEFIDFTSADALTQYIYSNIADLITAVISSEDIDEMFRAFNKFQILSPHRVGLLGVEHINKRIEEILIQRRVISGYENWYDGKPVIVTQNSYSLGLHNGDIGICFTNTEGEKLIYFQQAVGFKSISPARLPAYDTAYALTVHKSQGSEYDHAILILPDQTSRIVTQELLYTAVTRARQKVTIIGRRDVLKEGIQSKLRRSSGLKELLWKDRTTRKT